MATLPSATAANQPPPLAGHDLFASNRPLAEALEREGAGWAAERCASFGSLLTGEPLEWGRLANENPPQPAHARPVRRADRRGRVPSGVARADADRASRTGCTRSPGASRARARTSRARRSSMLAGAGRGRARLPDLDDARSRAGAARAAPELAAEWEPLLTSLDYDSGLRPAAEKRGALCGMAMTERQGGSDVRANITVARLARQTASTCSTGTSGSARRRCATRSSCSRRRRRALVLPRPARAARRDAQRLPHPAAEGQARRPLERVERDRARRRVGAARRRGGARRAGRSSRWSTTRGSTACSARRRRCAGRRAGDAPRRSPARPSASCSSTSR